MHTSAKINHELPLVVDLDGAITPCDTFVEGLVAHALLWPKSFSKRARARASRPTPVNGVRRDVLEAELLPLRQDFIAWLEAQRKMGRAIFLVTGAHQSVAEAIARRLPIFDAVIGSDDDQHVVGQTQFAKLAALVPDGYVYAGSRSDSHKVSASARGLVLVGASNGLAQQVRAAGKSVEREFPGAGPTIATWLRALRIHQWVKNALLLVPLLLSQEHYGELGVVLRVLGGILCLSIAASATYLINDLSDLAADRQHQTKRLRPIASGLLPARLALNAAGFMLIGALGGALLLSPTFAALLVAYVVLTVAYSLRLKAIAMLDVFVLGLLYTLRIVMGVALIDGAYSPWLLAFSLFFFFSLAIAKRHVEIVRAQEKQVVGLIPGRGYRASDAPITLAFGVSATLASIMLLFLYLVHDAFPVGAYKNPGWLWVIGFLIFLWTMRVWLKSHRGQLNDDPVVFAVKDKVSWQIAAAVVVALGLAIL